jgi:hypothetical protein
MEDETCWIRGSVKKQHRIHEGSWFRRSDSVC